MTLAEQFYYELIKEIGKQGYDKYVKDRDVNIYMFYRFIVVDINGVRVLAIPTTEYEKHKDVYIYCVFHMIRVFADKNPGRMNGNE